MGSFKLKPGADTVAYDELMKLRREVRERQRLRLESPPCEEYTL
jgi:hypothetical protein